MVAGERLEVRPKPLQVESGAPVEHYDRVRGASVYSVEETYPTYTRYVSRTLARLGSNPLTADLGMRGRAGG